MNRTLVQHTLDIRSTHIRLHSPEQDLHVLEGSALGLLNEEVDKDEVSSAEDAEHQEDLPADVVDGAGCHVGDSEVEEPLRGGGESDTVRSQTGGEDLGDVDPRNGAPGGGVADDEEVDHDDHGNGGR